MDCNCNFNSNEEVFKKIREKGFSEDYLPVAHSIMCTCGTKFSMNQYISYCPNCNMQYGVTPCQADDPKNIVKIKES